MVMVFLLGPATDFRPTTAQVLLARCSRDLMALLSEQAALRVKRKRRVVFREVPVADLRLRPADRDFPSLALRLKSVSGCRPVSAKQMALRMARERRRERLKPALRVGQSDQQVPVFSLPTP